jgi:hypothetical protein
MPATNEMTSDRQKTPMSRAVHMLLLFGVLTVPIFAQPESRLQETAPPPLKVISRVERAQIDEEKDSKERVKTTLELAESHLANAANKTAQQDFDAAAAEAGRYWALLEDVFTFMKTMKTDSNKRRDLYKRIELRLRAHGPQLSLIRRGTPVEHAVWIKQIEDFARQGRTEALNSFYGHTVVRDKKPSVEEPSEKPNQ